MSQKYTNIRINLETLRNGLDRSLRSDRQIAYMLEQIIEVAVHAEHRRQRNVVEFPTRPTTKLIVIESSPQKPSV